MLFVIHAEDHPDSTAKRLANYDAHKAYLSATDGAGKLRILLSGPLVSDDDEVMRGSLFMVEAPDRATVEAFNQADPFAAVGLWQRVSISAFRKSRG